MLVHNLTFKFQRAMKGLTLEFRCSSCGLIHQGSHHNKSITCPSCETGQLEPTKGSEEIASKVWNRVRKQEDNFESKMYS